MLGEERTGRGGARLAVALDREVHRARGVEQDREAVADARGLQELDGGLDEEEQREQRRDGAEQDQDGAPCAARLRAEPAQREEHRGDRRKRGERDRPRRQRRERGEPPRVVAALHASSAAAG